MGMRLSDFESYEKSPYRKEGFQWVARAIKPKGSDNIDLYNDETGERYVGTPVSKIGLFMADTLPFIKVFKNDMDMFADLSIPAYKILIYIMSLIKPGQERFCLSNKVLMDKLSYSSMTTPYIGITELLEKKFISKATGDCNYWINPNRFYNGARKFGDNDAPPIEKMIDSNGNFSDMARKSIENLEKLEMEMARKSGKR